VSIIPDLLKNNRNEELWQLCCGFLDWDVEQFMKIQNNLLLEQIELLKKCTLGKKVMKGARPNSIDDFRMNVPLTKYADYCPELLEQNIDDLPAKPVRWIQTSGKGGEYPFKWVPVSQRQWDESGVNFTAIGLLASCHKKGEVGLKSGMKFLYAAAQPPFLTGTIAYKIASEVDIKYLPDLADAERLSFEDRIQTGYKRALSEGMDGFYGLAGVLVAMGKRFEKGSRNSKKAAFFKQPRALYRVSKGLIKSKRQGRGLLPKDLWDLKMIISMGTDATVFKDRIKQLWGRMPLNVYGNTETIVAATQTWDYKDMVFFPNLNFFEFIPEEELVKERQISHYHPGTVLLNELEKGKFYELVITNLHGGALVRYRLGDLIRVAALRNEALGINLPQITLEGRTDDLIDLGFIRLNERVIWEALEKTGILYKDWTALKEIDNNPQLHLYLELAPGYYISSEEVAKRVYNSIKNLSDGLYVYKEIDNIEKLIDFKPIKVTILPEGTFSSYKRVRQLEGAMLTDLKPPHVNPSKDDLGLLGSKSSFSTETLVR
jgi:hypothetical protein